MTTCNATLTLIDGTTVTCCATLAEHDAGVPVDDLHEGEQVHIFWPDGAAGAIPHRALPDFDALRRAIRALRASGDLGYIDVERTTRDEDWVDNLAHVIEAYERERASGGDA